MVGEACEDGQRPRWLRGASSDEVSEVQDEEGALDRDDPVLGAICAFEKGYVAHGRVGRVRRGVAHDTQGPPAPRAERRPDRHETAVRRRRRAPGKRVSLCLSFSLSLSLSLSLDKESVCVVSKMV